MKRMIFLLIALMVVSGVCFAQEAMAPVAKSQEGMPEIFSGKIESVSTVSTEYGPKTEITLMGEAGVAMKFGVKPNTPITTADGRKVMISDLKRGDRVNVEVAVEQNRIAKSIQIQ